MPRTCVAVIGAGQAGLAVSRLLGDAGVDHAVLERGRTAQRWRATTWQSLRLLTPNWMSRLPGWSYTGPDPEGYMSAGEIAAYLDGYAAASTAPVIECADVLSVRACGDGYRVVTTAGSWTADAVVLATGWCNAPHVPGLAAGLDPALHQVTPDRYRSPDDLPRGGVLVVGASATGVQLADELARAGRHALVAVGRHSRLPRRYRGADIMRWLDALGVNGRTLEQMPDASRVLREPSLQLVGRPDHRDVHLAALQDLGVRTVGRLTGAAGHRIAVADDLPRSVTAADTRLRRLLARIDALRGEPRITSEPRLRPVDTTGAAGEFDLRAAGIRTVVWATGYRRSYPWLHVPVLDATGEVRHHRGATPAPGLFVVGMHWQSRRGSMTIDGVRHDAAEVVARVVGHLHHGDLHHRAGLAVAS